jgi:hypothetical protein
LESSRQTQWAAQFAVASELCKRGYEVAFTLGANAPLANLMVISPGKAHFLIDVKGLSRRSSWVLKRKQPRQDLYYVLTLVPRDKPNQFFILKQGDANDLVTRRSDAWDGLLYDAAAAFEAKWESLPA